MSRFDTNLPDSNVNTLAQDSYRNSAFDKTVKAVKIDGAIGYMAFDSIIREIITGVAFDTVTSSINGSNTEVLSFSEAGTVVREVQITYGTDTWTIYEYTGSLLLENGDFLLTEGGFKILLEG